MKQTKPETFQPTAMVICQHIEELGVDIEGPFVPAKCGCIMMMSLARAKEWKCPKCNQSDKEMWRPSSIEALSAKGDVHCSELKHEEGSPWLEH